MDFNTSFDLFSFSLYVVPFLQEKDFDRKRQENEDLREIISDYERRSALLENEISQMNEEMANLSNSHKEERKKLKARLHEIETQKQIAESSMRQIIRQSLLITFQAILTFAHARFSYLFLCLDFM